MGTSARYAPWKYGNNEPRVTKAKQALVCIARGDLVGQASGTITGETSGVSITAGLPFPASDTPWDTSLAVTQEAFHDKFLGVAQSHGDSADTDAIIVNTRGVHEFSCASASFNVGDLVGPAKQSGNKLEDQKVVAVATANLAIGRVAKSGSSVTTVLVDVFGTVANGGPMPPA